MKTKIIAIGMAVSFIMALYDIMAGLYIAVLTNTFCNYVVISRQKKVTTKVKKSRPMTTEEFKEKEMSENPHRPYPRHNPHSVEFTD
jgi:MFS superfamily sulfate permease-like transporter